MNKMEFFNEGYLDTLRAGNYNFEEALSELIDNSVDAYSSSIDVFLFPRHDNKSRLSEAIIFDNGAGMNLAQLTSAIQMGKKTKEDSSLTGKYGQGLKASTLKFCDKGTIVTKNDGKYYIAKINFNDIRSNNCRIDLPYEINLADFVNLPYYDILDKKITESDSFTLVHWGEINEVDSTLKLIEEDIIENVGRKFRKFFAYGLTINLIINGGKKQIKSIDVLKTDIGFDVVVPDVFKDFDVEDGYIKVTKEIDGKQVPLKIKFTMINEQKYEWVLRNEGDSRTYVKRLSDLMGISFVRSNREIELKNKFTSFYKPRNEGSHKYIGCEIVYSADFDVAFNTDAKKNKVDISKTSHLFPFFEQSVGTAFKEIERRNSGIASRISKEKKENLVKTSITGIEELADDRNDYLIHRKDGVVIINTNSKLFNEKQIIKKLVSICKEKENFDILEKLETILK